MKKKKVLPKFKNHEEEAKFWDTHSFSDYWEDFKEIDLSVELHKPRDKTLVIRVQDNVKTKLEKVAKSKGINVSALARMWLVEKLQSI